MSQFNSVGSLRWRVNEAVAAERDPVPYELRSYTSVWSPSEQWIFFSYIDMPVPENTQERPALKEVITSTNQEGEEETVPISTPATNHTDDVVIETKDAKPAKKKNFRPRLCKLVTTHSDRATELNGEVATDGIVEDGETCAKKLESLSVNGEKGDVVKENNDDDASDSEQVVGGITTAVTPPAKPLRTLAYDEITRLSRTMHYADFRKCFNAKKFITSKIRPEYNTLLPKDGDFVWFRAQNNEVNEEAQDWFGNVRCSFDLLNFLKENKDVNLFYVDCAYFGFSSASRILLSTETQFKNAKKIDLGSLTYGDPLMFDGEKLFFLRKDVSRNKKWYGNHQTEIVLDASTIDTGKLFQTCDVTAVNHSKANRKGKNKRFVFHQCLIFNSAKKSCPSAWTAEETAKCLKEYMGIESSCSVPAI